MGRRSGGSLRDAGLEFEHEEEPVSPLEGLDDVVIETEGLYSRLGTTVTRKLYPGMGHTINEDELRIAQGILDRVLGAD